ncbi:uncharacterized protein [Arachis hypogaea]|uniref:uncharacterized protein isoform X1 n=1 Tax=Arachis hypogaea TaxID=3818 RepID=UPI0007AF789B|nr:uncharacterized protein LOC112764456 isoform X4 [Arachis hypogaea]
MDSVCSEFQGKLNILFQYFLNDPLNYDLKYYVSAQPFLVFDLLEAYSRGFACLYFQTLSHICFSLSRKCNQRNREMKQRGRKHGKYMGPCCVLLDNVCMKGPKSSAICSLLQHVLLLDPMEKP